jgi:hypothetical protein
VAGWEADMQRASVSPSSQPMPPHPAGGYGSASPMQHPPLRPNNELLEALEFYAEPVVAWRAWEIDVSDRKGVVFTSVTQVLAGAKVPWPVRAKMRARCVPMFFGRYYPNEPEKRTHSSAPCAEHGCGIYAVRTEEQARKWAGASPTRVVGRVMLWGRVLVFTEGYLAEFAYPRDVLIENPTDSVGAMISQACCERYGVPYELRFEQAP